MQAEKKNGFVKKNKYLIYSRSDPDFENTPLAITARPISKPHSHTYLGFVLSSGFL